MKEKLRQCPPSAAAAPYPDGAVVDHQLDVSKRAGLILREHGTRDGAGRVQQQAAFVPRDQRASPQVHADEPRRPTVLVKGVPLVPQRHDVNGPTGGEGQRGRGARSAPAARGRDGKRQPRGGDAREPPAPGRTRHPRGAETMAGPRRARTWSRIQGQGGDSDKRDSPRPLRPLRGVFARNQLIPRRDPLSASPAARPTRSGPRRAASSGRARVRRGAGRPVRKCPGTSRAARLPPPGAAAPLGLAPAAGPPSPPAAAPPPGGAAVGETLGLRPLGGRAGAARAGPGVGPPRGRAAGGGPGAQEAADTKERPGRDAAEYK